MEDRLLKKTAILSFLMMLVVAGLSAVISQQGQGNVNQDGYFFSIFNLVEQWYKNPLEAGEGLIGADSISLDMLEQLGDKFILIKKQEAGSYEVKVDEKYMQRYVILTIYNLKTKEINSSSIYCNNGGYWFNSTSNGSNSGFITKELEGQAVYGLYANSKTEYEKLLVPEVIAANGDKYPYRGISQEYITDPLREVTIDYTEADDGTYTAEIHLWLDYIYAPVLYEDEKNIYLCLRKPKEAFETIVVIDAGHGGKDTGAFSKDEKYYEKDINLSIMKLLQKQLEKQDIKVYYTRSGDETVFLNPRVNLANEVEADLFLSIHCNSTESAVPSGSEVLYNEKQSGDGFLSKDFAQIILDEIVSLTGKINRGLVPASEMVVVGKSNIPVALVETAFLSNEKELQFLTDKKNQKKIAEALSRAIQKALNQLK